MSKFLSYLRNDKGGAVEYVLVVALVGGVLVAAFNNAAVKNAITGMFQNIFVSAQKKGNF